MDPGFVCRVHWRILDRTSRFLESGKHHRTNLLVCVNVLATIRESILVQCLEVATLVRPGGPLKTTDDESGLVLQGELAMDEWFHTRRKLCTHLYLVLTGLFLEENEVHFP